MLGFKLECCKTEISVLSEAGWTPAGLNIMLLHMQNRRWRDAMLRLAAFIGWEISKHLHGEPRSLSHAERKKEEEGGKCCRVNVLVQGFHTCSVQSGAAIISPFHPSHPTSCMPSTHFCPGLSTCHRISEVSDQLAWNLCVDLDASRVLASRGETIGPSVVGRMGCGWHLW